MKINIDINAIKRAKIAIIVSRFNSTITDALLQGAIEQLAANNIHGSSLTIAPVPGAVEIPLIAQCFAEKDKYDAIICLGAVIRGDTTHYDYVCQQVSHGCQKVMLDYAVPIIFGVLTTENVAQAEDRLGGKHGHKGKDAADAALEMIALMRKLEA